MKKIYVFVNRYPSIIEPNICVFIQQLIWTFADLGYDCNIVAPLPINLNFKYLKLPKEGYEVNENGQKIKIFHPIYFSLGQKGKLFRKIRVRISTFFYKVAANSTIRNNVKHGESDVVFYSHFIFPSGVVSSQLGKKYGVKSFMAHGEAEYVGNKTYGNNYLKKTFQYLTGVIAVSTQNKNFLVNSGVVEDSKVGIFPNGYRTGRFYKVEKKEARKHFGWNDDKFIVGFCGSFDERKGILRLQEAVDKIDNENIVFACAGKGKQMPTSDKCILKKPINNNELVYFYNAIDAFALPTQNEGCCNAIVEAMACGCPIISSNREFNVDILDSDNAILIDPNNVEELTLAIKTLKDNEKECERMSKNSLKKAEKLTLENRAKNIINFMNKS